LLKCCLHEKLTAATRSLVEWIIILTITTKGVRTVEQWGACPHNAETVRANGYFHPHNNKPSLSAGYTVLHSRTARELT